MCYFLDLKTVRGLGMVYFLFLFFFSGLAFTLTFLTHKNFKYSRYVSGADPGFFLGRGAPLRNDITDGEVKKI